MARTMDRKPVLILDFGAQYTQLIARRIREQRVYCEIHPCTMPIEQIRALDPQAIVLSGGPQSVYEEGAPTCDKAVFELGVPILGICYGMQLACHLLGGKVERADKREYGPAKIEIKHAEGVFEGFKAGEQVDVWMSHGDSVKALPPGFRAVATTGNTPFAAAYSAERKLACVQFHPEVNHTSRGEEMLSAFLFKVARCEPTWTPGSFAEEA